MVIESVCQNRLGINLAWNFFKEHIKEFYGRLRVSSRVPGSLDVPVLSRSLRPRPVSHVEADQVCH